LTAAKMYDTKEAESYHYLRQSGCYKANNVDDRQYFDEINESMTEIGFAKD